MFLLSLAEEPLLAANALVERYSADGERCLLEALSTYHACTHRPGKHKTKTFSRIVNQNITKY